MSDYSPLPYVDLRAAYRRGKDYDMTRDEIVNMQAGREMDVLIAEKIMGWAYHPHNTHYIRNDGKNVYFVPCGDFEPSVDISAAWRVIDRLLESDFLAKDIDLITSMRGWKCTIRTNKKDFTSNAETAPLAICKAALMAILL